MKTYKIQAILVMALLLSGCGKFLEEEPKAIRTSASYYKDETTLISGLYGIYASFQSLYRDYTPFIGELGTDESVPQHIFTSFNSMFRYQIDSNNDEFIGRWYRYHYTMIGRCNVVIDRGNAISPQTDGVRRIVAEAKMLRALAYFRLAQTMGPVALVLSETQPPIDYSLPRAKLKDVYAAIVRDMTEATAPGLLPETKQSAEPARLWRYAALGLLGKVYLTMAGHKEHCIVDLVLSQVGKEDWGYGAIEQSSAELYALAEATLDQVIGQVSLEPQYSHLFCQQYKNQLGENMWEIQFASGRPTGNMWLRRMGCTCTPFLQARDQKTEGVSVNQLHYNFRLWKSYMPGDGRKGWNLGTVTFSWNTPNPATGLPPNPMTVNVANAAIDQVIQSWMGAPKFRSHADADLYSDNGEADYEYQSMNFPLLRYADVVLMKVEANLKNNGTLDATSVELYNSIRIRARGRDALGNPIPASSTPDFPNYTAAQINADTILVERMREFCFESIRWFDLARTGKLVYNYNKNIDDPIYCPEYKPAYIDEHCFLMPIPQQQIDRSTNKEGFFQNPKY
ncbi:hypothetical protein FACS1894159_00570 [Bacteroidia bacterium]|nr:hypothetical protein FACS1894159_00570 [Bacteroidia bacterium]